MLGSEVSNGVVIHDHDTRWTECIPKAARSAEKTVEAFNEFVGPGERCEYFYSGGAPELVAAAKSLLWPAATSTPGQPASNGVAEREVRKVKEGTRCALASSGFNGPWGPYAARHFCFAANAEVFEGESCYSRRFGGHMDERFLRIPFGATVDYVPTATTAC